LFRTVLPVYETRGPECLAYTVQQEQDQLVQACRIPVIRNIIEKALAVARSPNDDDDTPADLSEALEALREPLGLTDDDFYGCRACPDDLVLARW
jgi:hypothetical protein